MCTSKTFSIRFWVNPKKAQNNTALLYARVTVNQKGVEISLKGKVSLELWDSKNKKVLGNSSEARQINRYLEESRVLLFQIFQDLKFQGELITAKKIKTKYLGEDESSRTLLELIEYHSKKIEHTHASGSIRNFAVTESYVHKFLEREKKTSDIYLKHLDYKFLCDIERFLHAYYPKCHIREMSHNTVMKHIQRLRKMVTLAYHLEWMVNDPFRRWKMTFEKKERDFLTANELSNIESYDFPIARLERVRDLFIFSCYTGISYVDIIKLTEDNILKGMDGNNWIVAHRQKTKTKIKVPLLETAQLLIQKYFEHPIT